MVPERVSVPAPALVRPELVVVLPETTPENVVLFKTVIVLVALPRLTAPLTRMSLVFVALPKLPFVVKEAPPFTSTPATDAETVPVASKPSVMFPEALAWPNTSSFRLEFVVCNFKSPMLPVLLPERVRAPLPVL